MTKEELLALKQHTRIKYTGSDPAVLKEIKEKGPKAYDKKGVVVLWTSDYTIIHTYADYRKRGIILRTCTNNFDNVNPADWVVVDDQRRDLTHQRERRKVRYADRNVRQDLDQFSETFKNMHSVRDQIDYYLKDVPLADKLKILTTLTPEQKAWFDLLALDPTVVIEEVRKLVERLNDNGGEPCSSVTAAAA